MPNKINGWKLFWLVTTPISLAIVLTMMRVDLSGPEGVSSMIQLSVRCAVPILFVAFAASSVQALFPGSIGRWLLRNRSYIGLCFAAAMGWQLTFILWLTGVHTEYYVNEMYVLSDAVEGVVGYALLIAMTLTSFKFGRRLLTQKQWKLLHTIGIYWLWYYAWSVYWLSLFYYKSPALFIDYVYFWGGFLAWGLRLAAWTKKRSNAEGGRNLWYWIPGVAALILGLVGASFGRAWSPQVYDVLYGIRLIDFVEPFMPYSPLVPFYPMLLMIFGAFLVVKSKHSPAVFSTL